MLQGDGSATAGPPKDDTQGAMGNAATSSLARPVSRSVVVPDTPEARKDTGILAASVAAVPLIAGVIISVIPKLGGFWPTLAGIAVVSAIIVALAAVIIRSASRLLVGQGIDAEIVAYADDRETGILLKGKIENVALRVETIHRMIDVLVQAVPPDGRRDALYRCGLEIGEDWVDDFRNQLATLLIHKGDLLKQILKWSEYDATAGMGRLTVAVDPATRTGLVTLANSFLSRSRSEFPLNWWFAGYLAGSLNELLGNKTRVRVELLNATTSRSERTYFSVRPEEQPAPSPEVSRRNVEPQSVARINVWIAKLKRPLPED